MTTQRKIHHVLDSQGNGDSFFYLPLLKAPIDISQPLLVTEKVDGTTVQGKKEDGQFTVYKRFDNFKPGDPRKHAASEAERYRLEKLQPKDPASKWIWLSVNRWQDKFNQLPEGLWVYFEALGDKIGARYKGLPATVRVFDTAPESGSYNPFETTVEVIQQAGLPLVAFRTVSFGDVETLILQLQSAKPQDEELKPYVLEGWVLRQGETVAKIRVKDLDRLGRGVTV
jgi:hypothetical protein